MNKKEIIRLTLVYFLITGVVIGGTLLLRKRFSEEWLDRMITSGGSGKQLTTDPCAYAIAGEPNAGGRYIKLIVTCKDNRQSWNTFDTRAIKADDLEQLLNEFHRINGISAETKKYKCNMDSAPIGLTSKLQTPTTINCIYE